MMHINVSIESSLTIFVVQLTDVAAWVCGPQFTNSVRLISLVARPTIFNYHFLTRRWQHRWWRQGRGRKRIKGRRNLLDLGYCKEGEREWLVFIAYVLRVVITRAAWLHIFIVRS